MTTPTAFPFSGLADAAILAGAVLLLAVLLMLLLGAFYALVMGVYRAHLRGRLSRAALWVYGPWLVLGFVIDVLAQYTAATLIFAELPRPREHLVTQRLSRLEDTPGWRGDLARWICTKLLDPLDPTGEHCTPAARQFPTRF